jgi:hypothetical protein
MQHTKQQSLPSKSVAWSGPKDGQYGRYFRFVRCGRTNLTYCETVVADNPFHAKMLAELETYK